jgi:hypothetical protein
MPDTLTDATAPTRGERIRNLEDQQEILQAGDDALLDRAHEMSFQATRAAKPGDREAALSEKTHARRLLVVAKKWRRALNDELVAAHQEEVGDNHEWTDDELINEDPDDGAALHEIYSALVDELDQESCMGLDGVSYESQETPGTCICRQCALARISDKIFALFAIADEGNE